MPINDTPFTPGWKEVMRQSRNEAGRLGHDYIGPEHFLLGIIRKAEGLAVQTLLNLGLDLDDVKLELERMLEVGKGPTVGIFPQNVEAKRVIESARNIAKQLKHNWIGTEHLLLVLLRENEGIAAETAKAKAAVTDDRPKGGGIDLGAAVAEAAGELAESPVAEEAPAEEAPAEEAPAEEAPAEEAPAEEPEKTEE